MRAAVHTPSSTPPQPAGPRAEAAAPHAEVRGSAGHSLARFAIQPSAASAPLPIQAAGLFAGLKSRVTNSGLYKKASAAKARAKAFAKTPGFQKARAIAGVLGLAGGYKQGYYEHGAEARGAFRDRWDSYLDKLPADQQEAARKKYSLPELPGPNAQGNDPVPPDEPPPRDNGPEEIEMQDMANLRPRRQNNDRRELGGIELPPSSFDSDSE